MNNFPSYNTITATRASVLLFFTIFLYTFAVIYSVFFSSYWRLWKMSQSNNNKFDTGNVVRTQSKKVLSAKWNRLYTSDTHSQNLKYKIECFIVRKTWHFTSGCRKMRRYTYIILRGNFAEPNNTCTYNVMINKVNVVT